MKKVFALLCVLTLALWSCQQSSAPATAEVPVTHKEINAEVVKTVANLNIEGMTCAEGCGGKIQQDLRALKGVVSTELDYADQRASNVVSVEYNPAEITETDLIKCVSAIADGQYVVKSVEILDYKGLQSAGHTGGSEVSTENFGRVFELLNLLQSVSKLIQ